MAFPNKDARSGVSPSLCEVLHPDAEVFVEVRYYLDEILWFVC